jgi:amino acid adenylation domain-containing protein
VPEQVLAQARLHPHQPAVICGNVARTYGDLVDNALRLASHLKALGLPPETHVIACMPRDAELVVTLLGIMLAQLAYVPVEPTTPVARRAAIAEQSRAGAVLTSLPLDWDRYRRDPDDARARLVGGQIAYTIFTSGSTGTPKGVSVPHDAFAHFVHSVDRMLDSGRPQRVLAATSVAFDVAALELFWSLSHGHTVCMATEADLADPRRLLALIVEHEIDLVQATPTRWATLATMGELPTGITALAGGEALSADLAGALVQAGLRVLNFYGPTETCIYSTAAVVESADPPITIGDVLGQTTVSIQGRDGQPVPDGLQGELWIGGPGLARGYLGDPRRTAAAFVPDSSGPPGQRAYRTGDEVIRGSRGIEFIGRTDDQVKLRGARVELGDVEAALRRAPEVLLAASVVVHDSLWAFYTSVNSRPIPQIEEVIAREIPAYMYPDEFVHIDEMPLTPSGKSDRAALKARAHAVKSPDESHTVVALVSALLSAPIGIDQDIFNFGASSLVAARLAVRIERQFGQRFSVGAIAALRTARAIEAAIRHANIPVE